MSDGFLPQPIILGNICRPPRNNNDNSTVRKFTYELSTVLNKFTKMNYNIIITGDLNINLLEIRSGDYAQFPPQTPGSLVMWGAEWQNSNRVI